MSYDTVITDAVVTIRDRFGVQGLRDLIDLAKTELVKAEAAWSAAQQPTEEVGDETRQFFVYFDEENPEPRR